MSVRKTGKISYFGGKNDTMAGSKTASGKSTAVPGIAVYNQHTLGGYWLVKLPNGKQAILQQTDIGPAPWTGRIVDFTESSLHHIGYNAHNFPTDAKATIIYLGKKKPNGAVTRQAMQSSGDVTIPGTPAIPGKRTRIPGRATVNPGGTTTDFQGAILDTLTQHPHNLAGAVLGKIASGAYDTTVAPSIQRGPKSTVVGPSTPGTPDQVVSGSNAAGGSSRGYFHPASKRLADERIDQGKDFGGSGPLYALGDGVIKSVGNLPGWPGTGGLVLHLTSGPWAGKNIFYAEGVRPIVRRGQRVRAGQHIAQATGGSTGIEIGFANAEGTNAQAHTHYSEGQQTAEGKHFTRAINRFPRRS